MPTDVKKLFVKLGLSESETAVYLSALAMGPHSVQEIAKKARLSRTAAYDAIEQLQAHGLMSTFERGTKKFFAAEDPERAMAHVEERVRRMGADLDTLKRALPELKLLSGGERPAVRFFEGNEALHALFSDFVKSGARALDEVSNMDDVYTYLSTPALLSARKVLDPERITLRILHRGKLQNQRAHVQFRELPVEFGDFHGDIWIYGNRVAFVEFAAKIVVAITESKPFADTARVLFEAAWRTGKSNG